ncbi:ribosome maturation protein [Fimicolochytrium jonesii]|uniref:ribosome maturation protein n=1 Tax=Fimicolochytrium jonesii TaxID=1396493 RepID=UPI0022FE56CC|nr:ribosome maturation protein [Fimicolochytrium jonesii]KAI8822504.1 ribosome maturation protein [Fimicolochytrium jonesii]
MPSNTAQPQPVRVVWHGKEKADAQTSGRFLDFFVFADPNQVEPWRKDKSIPIVDVVESFDIFAVNNGGNTGVYERPSRQQLDTTFGTHNVSEIIERILQEGKIERGPDAHLNRLTAPPRNCSKGAYNGRVAQSAVHN